MLSSETTTPYLRARDIPGEERFRPINAPHSRDVDLSTLTIKSVPIFPLPRMATLSLFFITALV
jgi:hypothetical protein